MIVEHVEGDDAGIQRAQELMGAAAKSLCDKKLWFAIVIGIPGEPAASAVTNLIGGGSIEDVECLRVAFNQTMDNARARLSGAHN